MVASDDSTALQLRLDVPESAFNLKGTIEDVMVAGKKILADAAKA